MTESSPHARGLSATRPLGLALAGLLLGGGALTAQEMLPIPPRPAEAPAATTHVVAPGPLGLEECVALSFERQPAIAAARASLSAAISGQQALCNLPRFANLLAHDLQVRRQQAAAGVNIAQAALLQAEWETRYAVTRNFYTVQFVHLQLAVIADSLKTLEKGRADAKNVLKIGDPNARITSADVDAIEVQIELLQTKNDEASVGMQKAVSALREAIGLNPDCPLRIAAEPLPQVVEGLCKEDLIALALSRRGEVVQAHFANRLTEMEIWAQERLRGLQQKTFAAGADVHARPVPQGIFNKEYRPGAIGIEMPPFLVGRKCDRVQRAGDLNQRAIAVVEKTTNLVALEVDYYYLNWIEARKKSERLARALPQSRRVAESAEKRLTQGKLSGRDYLEGVTLPQKVRAQLNEALYLHALAVAALERATAGGYRIPHAAPVAPTNRK